MKEILLSLSVFFFSSVVTAQFESSLELNGNDEFVHIDHDESLSMTNAMTIELRVWASNYDPGGWQEFVFKGGNWPADPNGQPREYYIRPQDGTGKAQFRMHDVSDEDYSVKSTEPLESGQCYHLAATYDGNILRMYVDGVLNEADTIGAVTLQSGSGSLTFGRLGDIEAEYYEGQIDEVRLWNIARSEEEICTFLNDTLPMSIYNDPMSGLVGYWRLDEMSKGLVEDLSLLGNHGISSGGMIVGACSSASCTYVGKEEIELETSLYPNPASSQVWLQSNVQIDQVSVIDISGKEVITLTPNRTFSDVDLSAIPSGIYFLRIQTMKGISTQRLVVR